MIKLRPHHLLCTQGYSGKGYSREFVENMTEIVKSIKNEKVQVQLIFSEDDICSKCPNLSENNICKSETVNIIDNKVIKYFELEEKIYEYESLIRYIKSHITKEIMDDICGNCEWYSISKCKKRMLVEI